MRLGRTVIVLAVVVGLAGLPSSGLPSTSSSPLTSEVQLKLPSALARFVPTNELIAPTGELWLFSAGRSVAVSLQTGMVRSSLQIPYPVATSPIIGPNDAIWFGEDLGDSDGFFRKVQGGLGEITADGHVHTFSLSVGDRIDGLVSGSDGNVWFTTTVKGGPELGRIIPTGRIRLFGLPSQVHAWRGALVPAENGGFWTTVQLADRDAVAYVSSSGRVRLRPGDVNARALDSSGVLWGWGTNPGRLYRVPLDGAIGQLQWSENPDAGRPVHGALVRAGDDQLWFTGATVDYDGGSPNGYPIVNDVLGTVQADGSVAQWPVPYDNQDGSPVGAVNQTLLPGSDGRLYAIGYHGDFRRWGLFATTLPNAPRMQPAQLSITSARATSRNLSLGLRCSGQPGLFCSGTITVLSAGRRIADQRYAIGPGLPLDPSISFTGPQSQSRLRIVISSTDPDDGQTDRIGQTVSLS